MSLENSGKTNKLHLHWGMKKHTNCLCLFYLLNIIHINISPSSFKDCKKVMLISSFIFGSLSDSCCPCYCQPPPNLFFILLKAKSIREPICLVFDLIIRKTQIIKSSSYITSSAERLIPIDMIASPAKQ